MGKRALLAFPLIAAVVAAAVVFSASGTSPPATGEPAAEPRISRLIGLASEGGPALVGVDRRTLRPRPGERIDLGRQGCASRSGGMMCSDVPPWSFSPDRSRLAVVRNDGAVGRSLRLVDVGRMRVVKDIPISGGSVGLVSWAGKRRLLAVQEDCCDEKQQLLVVDVAERRIEARRPLDGTVLRVARTPDELVLLVAPAGRIGAAWLAVADRDGGLRFLALDRTLAGTRTIDGEGHRSEQRLPGLAVDPARRRAFVVGPGLIADVDLARGAVSYHEPSRPVSLLGRLRDWLDPVAHAKGVTGPARSAHWLGGGVLAVTGYEEEGPHGDREPRIRPAGLSLVDTRTWTVRTVDRGATDVRVTGDLLLATGSSSESSIGLTAYGFDGRKRFQRFDNRPAWINQVYGRRAYVGVAARSGGELGHVVDLATGRATATRGLQPPRLLVEAASSWWDA
jgi:hypothetical protein